MLCWVLGLAVAAASGAARATEMPEAEAASQAPGAKEEDPEPGYIAIPGLDTRFKLTGKAQVNINYDMGPRNDVIVSYNALTLRNDPAYDNEGHFHAHARESRFGLLTSTKLDERSSFRTMLEIDFLESFTSDPLKDQTLNSYAPRIRHAFGEVSFGKSTLLFGQTWSTFLDADALSERLDQGSPGGSHFVRQAQVRYTLDVDESNRLTLAIENPQSAAVGTSQDAWKDRVPDFVAKWKYRGGWGFVTLQGVVRDIAVDDDASVKGDVVGLGVGVDGLVETFDKDNITFQLGGGPGIGRYIKELEGQDATWNGSELRSTTAYGGVVAYQHHWAERWRSNFIYAYARADNESFVTDANKSLHAAFVNVFFSPVKNFEIALQYLWARREIEDGTTGVSQRVASSFGYSF